MQNEPIKLVITMEGGIIQWISTGSKTPVDVYVLDFDTEGAEDDEVIEVDFKEGVMEQASVNRWELGEEARDPKFVEQIERKYAEGGKIG